MTKIPVTTLASLLTISELAFSYTTKDGEVKFTRGKEGSIAQNGNVIFFDLNEGGYRTVHANSEVSALLNKNNPNWQVPKKNYISQTASVNPSQLNPGTITHQQLKDLLNTSVVKFKYLKTDGTDRIAYGTTDKNRLPQCFVNHFNPMSNTVAYFDIEKQDIRAISNFSVIELIDTFDIPLKK